MEGEIVDAENYRGKEEGFGFKEIAMRQFQKVVSNMSQEMRDGIRVYSHVKMREPEITRYLPDTRKQFTQSLDCLHDIIAPKFDERMKTSSQELLSKIEEIKEGASSEKEYWINKLKIYRNLFQEICFFFERLGWLESESFEE